MIIPVGFSEVRYIYTSTDLPNAAMCSWGVENSDSLTPGQIAESAVGVWNANLKPRCPGNVGLQTVMVKNGPNETGPDAVLSVGSAGTGGGGTVIGNCAALIRKRTAIGGRKGRGRCFLPFVTETNFVGGGSLDPTYVSALDTSLDSWMSGMDSVALPLYLLHSEVGTAPTRITGLSTDALVGTQRRRIRG